jgi:2-polyprenyl-3-methyl-5-hydroxy-6-metoxy-1,4-benzoquinol methylase
MLTPPNFVPIIHQKAACGTNNNVSRTTHIIKSLIKKVVSQAVQSDSIWAILNNTIIRVAEHAKWERRHIDEARQELDIRDALMSISPDLTVKHGPFKGMIYPEMKAVGSSLVPKLLGSYEKELHPVLEKICSNDYCEIVDIGCAEGYYAVGLAMRIQTAKVFAYDTNNEAIYLCKQMALMNNVAERLVTGSFCDVTTLRSIPFTRKALIISDCEGYEKKLFTQEIVPSLAHHDLLIEVHDFIDIEISSIIRQRFQNTHLITAIQSIDDIVKAHSYCYEELDSYDLAFRRHLLAESRPSIMAWFYMTPRTN